MANGIIVIDKPAGWTSHDVVAKLRRLMSERRIGHGGTLDPMATGVLPVFVGRATRAVEFAAEGDKEYVAGLRLGVVTDTQDMTGTVLSTTPVTEEAAHALQSLLPRFIGEISQIPPMYSAIKQNGKKLYELARAGKEVVRPPRQVTIYALELLEQVSPTDFVLRIACSKGTYIRTLCHDMGQALGWGGALYSLRRTRAAGFTLEESIPLSRVMETEDPPSLLLPVDRYFAQYPALIVPPKEEKSIRNGTSFLWQGDDGLYRVYSNQQEFLMLGRLESGRMTTLKSFFEV